MKTRQGFVSNSSSSSFCILGLVKDERFDDENVKTSQWGDLDLSGTDLATAYGIEEYYGQTLVGIHPWAMKEDETLSEFKKRIVSELASIGVEVNESEIEWHVDGGFDG